MRSGDGDGPVHVRPADEVAAVRDDDAVFREQFGDPRRGRARVQPPVGCQGVARFVRASGCRVHALAPPAGRRADRRELVGDRAGDEGGIPADVPADVRVGRRGGEVDLEHARAGGEERAEAHRELVERRAEHDGDVGLLDQLHRGFRAEPAGHAEIELGPREDAASESRRGGECPGRVGEGSERVARPGDPRAAPGEQERALRAGQRGGGIPDRLGGERAARRDRLGQTGFGGLGHGPGLERGDVVGDREHGGHAIGQRVLDRDDRRRRGIRPAHRVGACADRRGEGDLVDAPGAAARCGLVADHQHEGHVRLHGFGERGQRVREPGAVGGGRGGEPAAGAVIGVGGDDPAGLVAHGGVADVGGALEGIEEVGVAVAHHPEDVVDVQGEGRGDVRGNSGHGGSRDGDGRGGIRMCLAHPAGRLRAHFPSTGAKRPDAASLPSPRRVAPATARCSRPDMIVALSVNAPRRAL